MLIAYSRAQKKYQAELHNMERPMALHTQILVNSNRDPKRQRKPHSIEEFYLYQPREQRDLPPGRCGAAALKLLEHGMLPSWSLFCYKDLVSGASGEAPPLLAFIAEDAMLLAPVKVDGGYKGMLIAQESAGGKKVRMETPCGRSETFEIPEIPTKYIAQDNVMLRLR